MYTVLENVRIVIALLKKHNIRHIVISPGGSNIPIVQGVQQDPFFICHSVVDERSAMYFAIGLYLKLGEPIATSCTSAQATRNYIPGLTEAFYKHVPILAITMSKHPMYLYQEYMQCPIQTSLPEDSIKKGYSLPIIDSLEDRDLCIRMTNEAILELTHHGTGPVQLNIEELDNQTWVFDKNATLPNVRAIYRYSYWDNWNFEIKDKKILILLGEHRPFSKKEVEYINAFCNCHNAVVYADHTSNYNGDYSVNAYAAINGMSNSVFNSEYKPDILITIGGLTGDYAIYTILFNGENFEHWRVCEDGNVVDTYNKLTKIFECPLDRFFSKLNNTSISTHSFYEKWKSLFDKSILNIEIPFSNMYAAQVLSRKIPSDSYLNLAILNSLRVWSCFPIDKSIKCFSNLAAFGIDGCLSTLVGESVVTDQLSFMVIGDLAFFYDMNALGIREIKSNLRILLVNNNGGIEFKLGDLQHKIDVESFIAADNHFRNAEGWAKTNAFTYISARNKNEFLSHIDEFVSANSEYPILFELFTTPENEKKANDLIFFANKQENACEALKSSIKQNIKNIVGEKILGKIKSQLL